MRYFWFVVIFMPPITVYYGIKYWKLRKLPGYEWYEIICIFPLLYASVILSQILKRRNGEMTLLPAICIWTGMVALSITAIHVFCKKKKTGTFKPGKEKMFIPGVLYFSFLIILFTAFVIAVALEGSI